LGNLTYKFLKRLQTFNARRSSKRPIPEFTVNAALGHLHHYPQSVVRDTQFFWHR